MNWHIYNGYQFQFRVGNGKIWTLPITPGEVKISSGSNNKTISLINEGDINILKSPSLIEISFDARFPMKRYPYCHANLRPFHEYFDYFSDIKENKKSVRFLISRNSVNMSERGRWFTNLLVSIEDLQTKESADEGDDVIVTFKLKQYKEYGIKTINVPTTTSTTTSTSNTTRDNSSRNAETSTPQTYTVKSGDCLWAIAKKYYGSGDKWNKIYDANKTVIENTAKSNRDGKGSSNGHWIYPGTKLTIPT